MCQDDAKNHEKSPGAPDFHGKSLVIMKDEEQVRYETKRQVNGRNVDVILPET